MSGEKELAVGILDFNCFFPTNPDLIVDITQCFITMKSKVRLSSDQRVSNIKLPQMDCLLNNTFMDIQNSGLVHTIGPGTHGSQLMCNLPKSS